MRREAGQYFFFRLHAPLIKFAVNMSESFPKEWTNKGNYFSPHCRILFFSFILQKLSTLLGGPSASQRKRACVRVMQRPFFILKHYPTDPFGLFFVLYL